MSKFMVLVAITLLSACSVAPTTDEATISSGLESDSSCPKFASPVVAGTRQFAESNEASGLAASRKNVDVVWTHDDSGDSARLFAMTEAGTHLGVYDVVGASFYDWEDLGIARLTDGQWYLFAGDIGGNTPRSDVQVYVVPEPSVSASQAPVSTAVLGSRRLNLHYPDGPHNAESLFVDPVDDALYILTKDVAGETLVFRKPSPHLDGTTTTLTHVATLNFSLPPLFTMADKQHQAATGADISAQGDEILVKTKATSFLYRRALGATVADAFAGQPCAIPNGVGEAIAFTSDGVDYLTTAEATNSQILRFSRQ